MVGSGSGIRDKTSRIRNTETHRKKYYFSGLSRYLWQLNDLQGLENEAVDGGRLGQKVILQTYNQILGL
jgi:hypothetical protein